MVMMNMDMLQDSGYTETDDRRKPSGILCILRLGSASVRARCPGASHSWEVQPEVPARSVSETQEVIRPVVHAHIETKEVESLTAVKPSDLNDKKAYELQEICNRWGIQTSGNKKVFDRSSQPYCFQEHQCQRRIAL